MEPEEFVRAAVHAWDSARFFTNDPPDVFKVYRPKWEADNAFSIGRPGVATEKYRIAMRNHLGSPVIKVDFKLRAEFEELIRRIPADQVNHRGKIAMVGYNRGQVAEALKKIDSATLSLRRASSAGLSDSESKDLFAMLCDEVLIPILKFSSEHWKHYCSEHEESSTGLGNKWGDMFDLSNKDGNELASIATEFLHYIAEQDGTMPSFVFRNGRRARPEKGKIVEGGKVNLSYSQEITRCRNIFFHFALSMYNSLMEDKSERYARFLSRAMEYLGLDADRIILPLLVKGDIYKLVQNLLMEGFDHWPYDGSGWDGNVATLLGRSFLPFMMVLGGYNMLPSGIFLTSLLGTLAMLVAYRSLLRRMAPRVRSSIVAVIHGDDLNLYCPVNLKSPPFKELPKFIEYQPADAHLTYIMGACYGIREGLNYVEDWREAPRLAGVTLMSDHPNTAMLRVKLEPGETAKRVRTGKHSPEEIAIVRDMYLGIFGGATLPEVSGKVGEAYSPRQALLSIV